MTSQAYIDKFARLKPSEDYALLRKQGIAHIEKMASQLWTDYNVHDPGITTLEMLSYAITDLGYRTSYPVEDILAEKTVDGQPDIQNFFSAREILPCNPVTKNDFRSVMIDVAGVKNAWLEMVDIREPQIYVDCSHSELTLRPRFKVSDEALLRLENAGVPADVRLQLSKLKNQDYLTREKFLLAVKSIAGAQAAQSYQWEILWYCAYVGPGRKIDPVRLQGLYDVILELEADPQLGDLNRCYFTIEIGESPNAFAVQVILPTWERYLDPFIDPADIQQLIFGALSYNTRDLVYEGLLKILLKDAGPIETGYRVISPAPKTEANRQGIENALKDTAAVRDSYQARLKRALDIVTSVQARLHQHRNLAEDFCRFRGIAVDDVVMCVDLEVSAEADIEQALAEVYYQVGHFLAPDVKFYSISELMNRGYSAAEIFEGPILQHGFIDPAELEASKRMETIRVSDIIQIIMDVAGVVAVKKILLTNISDGVPQTEGEEWSLSVAEGRAVRLDPQRSQATFYKGIIPYTADSSEVLKKLAELKALDRHHRMGQEKYDLPIPAGKFRNIQRYYSIQNDYPLCYGIGREGLPRSATPLRKAQAKQFKAYLLLYDQLLANYFAQLAHLKDLFSVNPVIEKTYFSRLLYDLPGLAAAEVPGVANLITEFVDSLAPADNPKIDIDDASTYRNQWDSFLAAAKDRFTAQINQREDLLESRETYEDRKNRVLDHLMARFNEKFTDYVLLMFTLNRKKAPSELIADKLAFLRDYPVISRDRGKAFNYKDYQHLWDCDNVSGLEKRVSRLLGMKSYDRRSLSRCIDLFFEIYQEKDADGIEEYRFRLLDEAHNILLSSSRHFHTEAGCYETMQQVIRFGSHKENYQPAMTAEGEFYFNLVDDQGQIIARRIDYFATAPERDQAIDHVIDFMARRPDCEGFHLIEHILLRPKDFPDLQATDDCLLGVCVAADCNTCSGWVDPYSYRVTVVMPAWPERFKNMDFRHFVESTFRQEAPAHVHVKICWVNQPELEVFEEKYQAWLTENAKANLDPEKWTIVQKQLIAALSSLRSVYPETRLYECVAGEESVPLLLNHSILGTTKKDK